MNQNIRSGGAFIETWRSFEADQALQTFEAKFDAPSQAVEVKDIFRREVVGWEGGQQNDPVGSLKGFFGNLIAFPLSITSGLAPRFCGGLFGLADGDQTQRKVGTTLAFDKDRPINAATFGRAQHGDEVDWLAILVAPACPFPSAAYQHVSAVLKDAGNAVGLQIGPIGNADLAFDDRDAIKRLPFLFICQFKVTEVLARQVEGAVNPPQVAFPQTIEQRWRRYINQPHRRGPGRCQSETLVAKTVRKDQAQQVYRAFYHTRLHKSAGLPRTSFKSCRAPKPSYDMVPVSIQKRFVSHPTLNHNRFRPPRTF